MRGSRTACRNHGAEAAVLARVRDVERSVPWSRDLAGLMPARGGLASRTPPETGTTAPRAVDEVPAACSGSPRRESASSRSAQKQTELMPLSSAVERCARCPAALGLRSPCRSQDDAELRRRVVRERLILGTKASGLVGSTLQHVSGPVSAVYAHTPQSLNLNDIGGRRGGCRVRQNWVPFRVKLGSQLFASPRPHPRPAHRQDPRIKFAHRDPLATTDSPPSKTGFKPHGFVILS